MGDWLITIILTALGLWGANPRPIDGVVRTEAGTWGYRYVLADKRHNLVLVDNFETKLTSRELMSENNCTAGINAGFYTTESLPLGWYKSDEREQKIKTSQLLNGFVWWDGKLKISEVKPENKVAWGFQSGPVVVRNSKPVSLSLSSDKPARRMVLGLTRAGNLVLMAVFSPGLEQTGPQLVDVPAIVTAIPNLEVQTAVNLDGGRASALWVGQSGIAEVDPVGAWLCLMR